MVNRLVDTRDLIQSVPAAERRRRRNQGRVNESNLFERVKPKTFFNPKDIKPTFPEKPPGQIDPKTGMHSEYGKQAGRYKRLDPISANAMPKTGDPEIDAVVDKQKTKPRTKKEKYIKKVAEQKKYSWRQDYIKESEWRPVTGAGPTNATSQTFGYFDGGGNPIVNSQTGQQVTTTASGLGGVEATSSTTTIDLGFGETLNVSSPTYDQLALAGITKPILMKRQETGDTNKKLDASQKFAQKVGADTMMNARVKSSNIISQTNTARKVFIDYLTGKMKAGRWNEYLGKKYINNALKNATLNPDGSVTVGDNVIGGARNIEYDKVSGTYKINFMGLGFQTNESEFAKNPADYSEFWKSVFNKLGKYSADAQPQFHVPTKVLQGWAKLLNIGLGSIFGKVIEYYKAKGTAIDVNAFIEFSPEEIFKLNPQLGKDFIQQKFGLTGEVWSPRMMGTPKGSDPKVTHNYYALYGKLPPRSVVKGSVPYNIGDHPEYDPAVIAKLRSMRGSSKPKTQTKESSKAVQTIKKMAKTKSIGFDRDEPIVRRRKKKK